MGVLIIEPTVTTMSLPPLWTHSPLPDLFPPPRNNICGWPCVLVYPTQVWIDCSRSYIVKQPLHARYWIIEICFRLCLFLTTLSFVNPYFKFILHLNITLSAISVYLYSCCTKTLRWKNSSNCCGQKNYWKLKNKEKRGAYFNIEVLMLRIKL